VLDAQLLEDPPRDLTAHVLVEVHLPNSVDRAPEPRVGNNAMFVVSLAGAAVELRNCWSGSITASGTLSVDTHTLTNQANQVDVGEIWQKVDGGYLKTTGTVVQPGGFMSAANMDLNVQTLNQIGGALQKLAADGTVDAASTQAMLASLQRQLGGEFTQETLADHLHSEFVKQGGFGPEQLLSMAAAVALSTMGMPVVGAMVSSAMNQAFSDQGFSFGQVLKAGAVASIMQDLTAGLGLGTVSLQAIGNSIASNTVTAQQLLQAALQIAGRGLVSATVNTVAYGGSFGTALRGSVVSDLAAVAASAVGQLNELHFFGEGGLDKIGYVTAHAALGCAASAASGTGCAGGALGGALSAGLNPIIDATGRIPAPVLNVIETLVSASVAGALGFNVQGAVSAAQNETQNNWLSHVRPSSMTLSQQEQYEQAAASCQQQGGSGPACNQQNQLAALSAQNDQNLAQACAGGANAACQAQIQAAKAGGNLIFTNPLGGGLNYTYANPLQFATGPESVPFSYANGPQITNIPTSSGSSVGAATLNTMLGSPLAGAFAGMVYALGGSNERAYSAAQMGVAVEGILAGAAGYSLPKAPGGGARASAGRGSDYTASTDGATNSATTTLYRAVSPEEYSSIMNSGQFSFGPAGSEMKQFGFNLNEVLNYANFQPDYAAIVSAQVPTRLLGNFNVSNAIDPFIFKNGVLTVNGQSGLNLFNSIVKNVGHAY
jgi:filamentous hemagglutinin